MKHKIYSIIKDFEKGKIDKYEAMDALGIDYVVEFMDLVAEISPDLFATSAHMQMDPDAAPIDEYLSND